MVGRLIALFALAGCRQVLGFEEPARDLDAAIDMQTTKLDSDIPPDSFDLASCPTDYIEVQLLPTSRYRVIGVSGSWWVHHADCLDDGRGTHLAVPNSVEEGKRIGALIGAPYYIGLVQDPGQTVIDAGWRTFEGTPPAVAWSVGQPDDNADNIENGNEQVGIADFDTGTFRDSTGDVPSPHPAICECDGRSIDPSVTIPPPP